MEYLAKKRKRALEVIIDYTIYYIGFFVCLLTLGHPNLKGEFALQGMEALSVIGLWIIYFPLIEGNTGQTLGKKIVGIRVVTLSGGDINFGQSLLRHLFDMVDLMAFGIVGILVMKNSDKSQRVGDLIAKTIVIEEQVSICEKCGERVILNKHEFLDGKFICPKCEHANVVQNSWQQKI